MIHNRILNKKINKIPKIILRIVYGDHETSFRELLNTHKSVTIHQKTSNMYLLKSMKSKKSITPTIMNKIIEFFENPVCELRNQPETHVQFSSVLNP